MAKDHSEFVRNVGIVSLGPLFVSIIGFLMEPVLARFWPPTVFGMGSYFTALLQIITPSMFLRYNFAIVQSSNEEEAHNLFALSLLIFGILTLGVIACLSPLIFFTRYDFPLASYKVGFIISIFFGGISILTRFWSSHRKQFMALSWSTILLQVTFILLLFIFGVLHLRTERYMIFSRVISYVAFAIVPLWLYLTKDVRASFHYVTKKGIIAAAKKFRLYPLYEYWGFIASIIAYNLPVILITKYWGKETAGLYSKAFLILYMFVALLGDSVSRVLHKESADLVNRGESLAELLNKVTSAMVRLSMVPLLLILLAGPELFAIFLGAQWALSGKYAQAIIVFAFGILFNLSVLPLYGVLNKQKIYTVITVLTLVLRIAILMIMGKMRMDFYTTIWVFSLVNLLILQYQTNYIINYAGGNSASFFREVFILLAKTSPLWIIGFVIKVIIQPPQLWYLCIIATISLPYLYWYYIVPLHVIERIRHFRGIN
jgi:O-antigen/teichoic acid export membrane protein